MKSRGLIEGLFFFGFCAFYLTLWPGPASPMVGGMDSLDWDSVNILTWQWAVQNGQVPLLDFWYPYFCRIYVQTHNWGWVLQIVQIGIIYFCFLYFCKRDRLFVSLFFWILAAAFFTQFPGAWLGSMRYLLGLSCVWFWVAALEVCPKRPVLPFLAGGWLGNAFFLEPAQAVPALLCGALASFFLLQQNKAARNRLLTHGGYLFLGSFSTFVLWCGGLAFSGNLASFWSQIINLPQHTNSCLWPANLMAWWKVSNQPENLVLLLTIAGLGLGVYGVVRSTLKNKMVYLILFITSLFSAFIFLKHLVRPHMALQFLIIPTAGLSLVMCRLLCEKLTQPAGRFLCYLASGAGAALFVPFGDVLPQINVAKWLEKIRTSPQLISGKYLQNEVNKMLGMQGAKQFWDAKSIYVLGDNSFWYILKPQAIPPYVSFYNMAPKKSQIQIITWLDTHKPEIVLWEPAKNKFDGVPNTVRCPLIFDYIVRNYFLNETPGTDRIRILKRKNSSGVSNNTEINSWVKNLGNQVEYGFIPTVFHSFPPKEDDLQISVIRITGSGEKDDKLAETTEKAFMLDFGDGKRWEILFRFPPGTESATVRLDRLWFYSFYAAQIDALDFQILAVNNTNLSLEKKRISVDYDSLY